MDLFAAISLIGLVFVIDGDTIELRHPIMPPARIRLEGVAAAERRTPAGKRAKAWLENLAGGRWAVCELRLRRTGWPVKSYERFVANCRVGGADLAGLLLEEGHAEPWR